MTNRIELLSHVLIAPSWPTALLAKEAAGIDAVSGGRPTPDIGVGAGPDNFLVAGHRWRGAASAPPSTCAPTAMSDAANRARAAKTRRSPLEPPDFPAVRRTRRAGTAAGRTPRCGRNLPGE
ncbi:hypothetical protein [Amycolatopsis sp. NPDC006125]|uniref:hypothetical protein n=1 Tax=Amycolatopsis sp. NPDC006125 TaxID=3156730 RepID=UPI0033B7FCD6